MKMVFTLGTQNVYTGNALTESKMALAVVEELIKWLSLSVQKEA